MIFGTYSTVERERLHALFLSAFSSRSPSRRICKSVFAASPLRSGNCAGNSTRILSPDCPGHRTETVFLTEDELAVIQTPLRAFRCVISELAPTTDKQQRHPTKNVRHPGSGAPKAPPPPTPPAKPRESAGHAPHACGDESGHFLPVVWMSTCSPPVWG